MIQRVTIRSFEQGLVFRNGEFTQILSEGTHWIFDPLRRVRVDVVSRREPWLVHDKLDLIVQSGRLSDHAAVVDLKDNQRGLVWIDGRFNRILAPGMYVYWLGSREVQVEVVNAREVRLQHDDLKNIVRVGEAARLLDICQIPRNCCGVLFIDGKYVETVAPGRYAFWKEAADSRLVEVDLRETVADVGGQDVMTADKVTLRLNVVVTYRVTDARLAVMTAEDPRQALYREAQLAVRAIIGTRELDAFLADKDAVAREIDEAVRLRATELGLAVHSVGIRDIILPGEMKDLMNKVTEAKKAAEANLIVRREETAAVQSQANTARLLAENPTLMRLRELEVLEKIATNSKLHVVLGEKGLADRITNLL